MIYKVQAYEVAYHRHRNGANYTMRPRIFKTIRGAAEYLAWRMIWDKYGAHDGTEGSFPPGLDCTCTEFQIWRGCPVHDHQRGYFRRLHRRLSAVLRVALRDGQVRGR